MLSPEIALRVERKPGVSCSLRKLLKTRPLPAPTTSESRPCKFQVAQRLPPIREQEPKCAKTGRLWSLRLPRMGPVSPREAWLPNHSSPAAKPVARQRTAAVLLQSQESPSYHARPVSNPARTSSTLAIRFSKIAPHTPPLRNEENGCMISHLSMASGTRLLPLTSNFVGLTGCKKCIVGSLLPSYRLTSQ